MTPTMELSRSLLRRRAAYVHAIGVALEAIPAPDREAILEDVEDHIAAALAEHPSEDPALALEEVLAALGSPEQYAASLQDPFRLSPSPPAPTRLCKLAALGFAWSLLALLVVPPAFLLLSPASSPGQEFASPTLTERLLQGLAWLSLAGWILGPVCSGVALAKIRASHGQLSGCPLGVVGLWMLPLAIVDGIVVFLAALVGDLLGPSFATVFGLLALLIALYLNLHFLRRGVRNAALDPA